MVIAKSSLNTFRVSRYDHGGHWFLLGLEENETGKLAQGDTIMSTEFASASLTAGQLNAIVKKLGGHDMALRFLRDELSVSSPSS